MFLKYDPCLGVVSHQQLKNSNSRNHRNVQQPQTGTKDRDCVGLVWLSGVSMVCCSAGDKHERTGINN